MPYDYATHAERTAAIRGAVRHHIDHYGITLHETAVALTYAGYRVHPSTVRTLVSPSGHCAKLDREMITALALIFNVPRSDIASDDLFYDETVVKIKPQRPSKFKITEDDPYPAKLPPLSTVKINNPVCLHMTEHAETVKAIRDLHRRSPVSDRCSECQTPHPCQTYTDLDQLHTRMIDVSTTE